MADVTTSPYGFIKPEVGASKDTWGDKLNANWENMDTLLGTGFTGGTPTDIGLLANAHLPAAIVTTNPTATGSLIIKAPNTTSYPSLVFRRSTDIGVGTLVWDYVTDRLILRKYMADGIATNMELILTSNDILLNGTGITMAPGGTSLLTVGRGDARYLQITDAATDYLPRVGGTLTGSLSMKRATNTTYTSYNFLEADGSTRWSIAHTPTVDGDFQIQRLDNTGAYQDTPLIFDSAGTVSIGASAGVNMPGGALTVTGRTANTTIIKLVKNAASNFNMFSFADAGGISRWNWVHSNVANGDLYLQRCNSAGSSVANPVIFGDDGSIAFIGDTTVRASGGGSASFSLRRGGSTSYTVMNFNTESDSPRWQLAMGTTGSPSFSIQRCDTSGVFVHAPISISADGSVVALDSRMQAKAIYCRAGDAAASSTTQWYNLNWVNPNMQLWISATNVGNLTYTSDYRTKKDIAPLPSKWDVVKALRPISYTQAEYHPPEAELRQDEDGNDLPLFSANDDVQWGFVAHELQENLIPSAATGTKDEANLIQSPNVWPLVAALTSALQEAMLRIEALEAA